MNVAFAFLAPTLRLGPMRLTTYGFSAAAGVLLATLLSARIAQRLGLSAEAAWDVGLFAVICCFATSRLLLILSDPVAFMHFPIVVLSLPSLTFAGMALAGCAVWVYLHRRKLPVLSFLDAFAPGGALLAAFLELGHWMDGTDPGMLLPKGPTPLGTTPGPVHLWPAAALGVLSSVLLAVGLLFVLRHRPRAGVTAALAIGVGGLLAFLLDLISLPLDLFPDLPLEPGQIVALAAMLTGGLVWLAATRVPQMPKGLNPAPEILQCPPKT